MLTLISLNAFTPAHSPELDISGISSYTAQISTWTDWNLVLKIEVTRSDHSVSRPLFNIEYRNKRVRFYNLFFTATSIFESSLHWSCWYCASGDRRRTMWPTSISHLYFSVRILSDGEFTLRDCSLRLLLPAKCVNRSRTRREGSPINIWSCRW